MANRLLVMGLAVGALLRLGFWGMQPFLPALFTDDPATARLVEKVFPFVALMALRAVTLGVRYGRPGLFASGGRDGRRRGRAIASKQGLLPEMTFNPLCLPTSPPHEAEGRLTPVIQGESFSWKSFSPG